VGKSDFADLVLERRMAKGGAKALEFIEDSRPASMRIHRQARELQEYKAECLHSRSGRSSHGKPPTGRKSGARHSTISTRSNCDLLPIDGVLGGMFRLCERLFGIKINERPSAFVEPGGTCPPMPVEVWHPEVNILRNPQCQRRAPRVVLPRLAPARSQAGAHG
jgi:oligopeptidase A